MPDMKLLAMDPEDLQVISALLQDSVVRVGDMGFANSDARFACMLNRFVWEQDAQSDKSKVRQRRRCAIHFDHVVDVKSTGINLSARDGVLELLSIEFKPGEAPTGNIFLNFAGGGTIELDVECLEARMSDLGARWEAKATPAHPAEEK